MERAVLSKVMLTSLVVLFSANVFAGTSTWIGYAKDSADAANRARTANPNSWVHSCKNVSEAAPWLYTCTVVSRSYN
ncbi:hypothetical protein [Pseudoalteromonas luteoviolacea]|uniref:Uncharacterized protein n=1 Tax=Pseudoalteromonas luteoviolacea (strain 2ta16) TaxID=1353533 RepID=V4HVY8_PSEL2|nr:hypothetical protein [Pseudoalteromonas luteoviolacea]ESP94975.1 hypothetical protein PL2TA16_04531 [Pseudoalteromonas luteoviolacea 2ta16]KZN36307.1 hypothetical protein N483_22615 [Pseudoalteromonas luteoviolacea NCIMB 1944]